MVRAVHFFGEPHQRANNRHAGGVRRRLAEDLRQLRIAEIELHATDDGFTLIRLEPGERGVVLVEKFLANRGLERRRALVMRRESSVAVTPRIARLRSSFRIRFITAWRR